MKIEELSFGLEDTSVERVKAFLNEIADDNPALRVDALDLMPVALVTNVTGHALPLENLFPRRWPRLPLSLGAFNFLINHWGMLKHSGPQSVLTTTFFGFNRSPPNCA